jgi:branched-subunit amino acid aminotransferase/4-amino-4-deoxychorismate lyase
MVASLIETVRVRDGIAPLWPLHLRRLVASCQTLGIPFPRAFEVPEGGPDRVHRLEVGVGGMAVSTREVGSLEPVRLSTSDLPHLPYRHKTTERATFASAAAEAIRSGADDALLLTARGEVAEATIWCIFWWEGEALCAPSLELGVLPGVSRMRLAEIAGPITGMRVGRGALTGKSIFLTNAARGVVEVATLDRLVVPRHPATLVLKERFWT